MDRCRKEFVDTYGEDGELLSSSIWRDWYKVWCTAWYAGKDASTESDDDANNEQEADSGREADQLLIEADEVDEIKKRRCVNCQRWNQLWSSPQFGICFLAKKRTGANDTCRSFVENS